MGGNETVSGDSSDSDLQLCSNCTVTHCPEGFYYNKRLAKCIALKVKVIPYIANLDVDECTSNKNFCSQKCINKPGSYDCECFGPLYKLARNGRRCYRTDNGTEGIAVDWIHRNLYTLRHKQLHVQRLDGLYRASLYDGFFQLPRALVAYPSIRELFASDWGVKPFIVRLAMDGTQAKKIVTENLVWPNGLALDYFARRLYWADAFRDVIEMANLDGTSRRVIISDKQLIPHIFGLTVFDDMILWSDWTRRGFLFADKLIGQNSTVLMRTVLPPYSLKAYHPAMQITTPNLCEVTTCQHICVPKLDGSGPQCLCAEGFVMHENGLCEPNCKEHQLLCSQPDHKCLNLIYRCDESYNCRNGDDEMECPIPICMHDERMFPCRDNRKCILRSQRCDGFVDCYDKSDEFYCADLAIAWSH
uniref:EGF-like domain-containing protein n=1 Tax=Loa loa TaxID=7209 RepID=A0A1I7VEG2_LOALO